MTTQAAIRKKGWSRKQKRLAVIAGLAVVVALATTLVLVALRDQIVFFYSPSDVVAREVGEETMLLNLASGTYFGLDPVGGRFWQLLEEGKSATEARDALLQQYDVAPEELDRDLEKLLADLAAHGLVSAG